MSDSIVTETETVRPHLIREWLAAHNWALTREKAGVAELWTQAATERSRRTGITPQVLLPLDTSFEDYSRRLSVVFTELRREYDLSARELLDQMLATRSDLFFVRLDQDSRDGTIPLVQATAALVAIQKMVRAAATTAADPSHSHLGRRPGRVKEFVDSELRLGHTKQGSFIITVAARLDDDDDEIPPTFTPGERDEYKTIESPAEFVEEVEPGPKPFSRQVMETLASALVATKESVAPSDGTAMTTDLDTAMARGVSLELVQSLIDVTSAEGLKKVDLSFDWASAGPKAPDVEEIVIQATELERLREVRDRLIRKEEPLEQTLVGRVAELGREESGGVEQHEVTLEADFGGKLRRIRVPLSPRDHDWAIFAYQRRLLFTVTGTPIRHQRWFLEGNIRTDVTFLESVKRREENEGRSRAAPKSN